MLYQLYKLPDIALNRGNSAGRITANIKLGTKDKPVDTSIINMLSAMNRVLDELNIAEYGRVAYTGSSIQELGSTPIERCELKYVPTIPAGCIVLLCLHTYEDLHTTWSIRNNLSPENMVVAYIK